MTEISRRALGLGAVAAGTVTFMAACGAPSTQKDATAEAAPSAAASAIAAGAAAPDFTAVDSNGVTHTLSQYTGKTVVLEWTNHDCPFVKKHYNGTSNMQDLQRAAVADGIVWLSVISSAPGKQGNVTPGKANELTSARNAAPSAILLDETGVVGRLYDAKTTPHMFVIGPDQKIVYHGAIDDNSSAKPETVAGARNYVREALAALKAGRTPEVTTATPYGCSVKYAA
jgi:peroxiredoxin